MTKIILVLHCLTTSRKLVNSLQAGTHIIGMALYKYDTDTLIFTEVQVASFQSGLAQIQAKITEGVFVLKIETMTSTSTKFSTATNSRSMSGSLHKTLIGDPCFKLNYSYYITSIYDKDSKQISFFDIIASMMGFKSSAMSSKMFDHQLAQEIGDSIEIQKVSYDELPHKLEGNIIDSWYKVKEGKQQQEFVDIIVVEDSLLKIIIVTKSPKDNINMFLYDGEDRLIANSQPDFDYKELIASVKAQTKAYKLKIVYDQLDEYASSIYSLRVALAPLQQLISENLQCDNTVKTKLPSELIIPSSSFDEDAAYSHTKQYQISLRELLQSPTRDINIKVKGLKSPQYSNKTLYFDIETSFDFLTTDAEVQLYKTYTSSSKSLISGSKIIDEDDSSQLTNRLRGSQEIIDVDIAQFQLRVSFSNQSLQSASNLQKLTKTDLCMNIELQIIVSASITQTASVFYEEGKWSLENELVRVDWQAKGSLISGKDHSRYFDPRQKLSAVLEFKQPIQDVYKTLKFDAFAFIAPFKYAAILLEDDNYNLIPNEERLYPDSIRLSHKDQIYIDFKHSSLTHGECYFLVLDADMLETRDIIDGDSKICMSKCQCNVKGMKGCNEDSGQCECRTPFSGDICDQCEEGYTFETQTQQCLAQSKCRQDGGSVDCNGHGNCFYEDETGLAKCDCNDGFTDDGLDLCGKCKDTMFPYPYCLSQRLWMVDSSNFDCDSLPSNMPTYLYKNSSVEQSQIYQSSDTYSANWQSTYKLSKQTYHQKRSEHYFLIPPKTTSVLRLFMDTHSSGVSIKYTILDQKRTIIYQSKQQEKREDEVFMSHITNSGDNGVKPFTLVLVYEVIESSSACPRLEILFILNSLPQLLNHLRCTQQQLSDVNLSKQTSWRFNENSQFSTQSITLSSNDAIKYADSQFYRQYFTISIATPDNALSFITTYDFEKLVMGLTLRNKVGEVMAIQKYLSLEGIDQQSLSHNIMSVIEMPKIDQGEYELEVALSKSLFMSSNSTCLSFEIIIEYVVRDVDSKYEVIAILPTKLQGLTNSKEGHSQAKIDVKFGSQIDIEDFIRSYNDIHTICYLQNKDVQNDIIYTQRVITGSDDSLTLYFNFIGIKISDNGPCYRVKCSTQQNLGEELIRDTVGISTDYCFASSSDIAQRSKCNPNAFSIIYESKCECTYPYRGQNCEDCESNYLRSLDSDHHAVCTLDVSICSKDLCNNHGECVQPAGRSQQPTCKCANLYSGSYCEQCSDSQFSYPDCQLSEGVQSLQATQVDQGHYKIGSSLKDNLGTSDFEDLVKLSYKQCPITSYPRDLNRIEYMNFINGGDFHIAEQYTVNHKHENFIKLRPKVEGTIKILIQQPQKDETLDEQIFDFEIALYDFESHQIVSTITNSYLQALDGKLSYAVLEVKIDRLLVNKPLLILFRVISFSEQSAQFEECEDIYLEIQYKSGIQSKCDYNPKIQSLLKGQFTVVENQFSLNSNQLSVYDEKQQFFFHQDFYFTGSVKDFDLYTSIHQKFSESNVIDFVVELIEEDIDLEEARKISDNNFYSLKQPQCSKTCFASGSKGFNHVTNTVTVSSRTYLRFWLFQTAKDICANYQLFLEATIKVEAESNTSNSFQCSELDMPHSLNTERYLLGPDNKQRSFHYMDSFRVDNLQQNSGLSQSHGINFNLSEATLVRIVAPIHKHRLEFDILLVDKDSKLVSSVIRGQEDSIFIQLSPGKYAFTLLFSAAEAHILRQPCQSIEIEMAFTSLKDIANNSIGNDDSILLEDILQGTPQSLIQSNAIKTFSLSSRIKDFNQELFKKRFTVLKGNQDLGLMIQIESDFLLSDVQFSLKNLATRKVYTNKRLEGLNKLLVQSILPGEYELSVFTQSCLTNINSSISILSFNAKFTIQMTFYQWQDVSSSNILSRSFVLISTDNQSLKIPTLQEDRVNLYCLQNYGSLPKSFADIEFNHQVMIPDTQYEHTLEYQTISNAHTRLRILVSGRPNTKVLLFQKGMDIAPLFESFLINGGQDSLLVAKDLKHDRTYVIEFQFGQISTQSNCDSFRLHILSTPDEGVMCQKDVARSASSLIKLDSEDTSVSSYLIIKTQSEMQQIQISSAINELLITIDYSQILYIPTLKLLVDANNQSSSEFKKTIGRELKPSEVLSQHKNMAKYRFTGLNKNSNLNATSIFYIQISQSQKPQNCINKITFNIQAKGLMDENVLEKPIMGGVKTYGSQDLSQAVDAQILPVTLDTYKYLSHLEQPYLIISENFKMNSDPSKNKIRFTLDLNQGWNSTLARFYLESTHHILTLRTGQEQVLSDVWKTQSLTRILGPGSYELLIDYSNPAAINKGLSTFRITILLAEKNFYNDIYLPSQINSFKECSHSTSLPLILNKRQELSVFNDQQTFDEPLMRLNGKTLMFEYILDNFNFRVNETSHFMMSIGTHLISDHVSLRLSEMRDYGNAYIGRQEFGVNTIDVIVGPGDYSLQIEQPWLMESNYRVKDQIIDWLQNNDSIENICGLFSIEGRVTPLSDYKELAQNGVIKTSHCEIREVLPSKIYKAESETKGGSEYFVNSDGTFSHFFEEILIKKADYSDSSPLFDRFELTAPQDGLLSLTLQYPSHHADQILVRISDAQLFTLFFDIPPQSPLVSHVSELLSNGFTEETILFSLVKGQQYLVMVYYKGSRQNAVCEYYNVMITFNTIQRMQQELQCIEGKHIARLMDDLPQRITPSEFIEGKYEKMMYTVIKYPRDYPDLVSDRMLIKQISLDFTGGEASVKFDIDVRISFDTPFSMQQIGLYEQLSNLQYDEIAVQNPLVADKGDNFSPTLERTLSSRDTNGNKKYTLAISDYVSRPVFEFLTKSNKSDYCLYQEFTLMIQLRNQKALKQLTAPLIMSTIPAMKNNEPLAISSTKKNRALLQVSITFSTAPYLKNDKLKPQTAGSLASIMTLSFSNQNSDSILYQKSPQKVVFSRSNTTVTLNFNIQEELSTKQSLLMRLLINQDGSLVDSEGHKFALDKNIILPSFILPAVQIVKSKEKVVSKEQNVITQQDKVRSSIVNQTSIVKCQCTHGQCKKGESLCFKCDLGWTGSKCDQNSEIREDYSKLSRENRRYDDYDVKQSCGEFMTQGIECTSSKFTRLNEQNVPQNQRLISTGPSWFWYIISGLLILLTGIYAFNILLTRNQSHSKPKRKGRKSQATSQPEEEATELIELQGHDQSQADQGFQLSYMIDLSKELKLYSSQEELTSSNHGSLPGLQPQSELLIDETTNEIEEALRSIGDFREDDYYEDDRFL